MRASRAVSQPLSVGKTYLAAALRTVLAAAFFTVAAAVFVFAAALAFTVFTLFALGAGARESNHSRMSGKGRAVPPLLPLAA